MSNQFKPEDYFNRCYGGWVENPQSPLLLTFESAGDEESDIAWVVRGSFSDLGRYTFCPHLSKAIGLLNKSLIHNDGIGLGGEAALHDLNQEINKTRFHIESCAVKAFIPVIEDVIKYQNNNNDN